MSVCTLASYPNLVFSFLESCSEFSSPDVKKSSFPETGSEISSSDTSQSRRSLNLPKSVMFVPAGASYSMLPISKKKASKRIENGRLKERSYDCNFNESTWKNDVKQSTPKKQQIPDSSDDTNSKSSELSNAQENQLTRQEPTWKSDIKQSTSNNEQLPDSSDETNSISSTLSNARVVKKLPESTRNDDLKPSTSKMGKISDTSEDTDSKTSQSSNAQAIQTARPQQMVIKPHCSCSKCTFWTETKDWVDTGECSQKPENKPLFDFNHSLFKKETSKLPQNILSLDYSSSTKLGKRASPKLLLHR